MTPLLSWLLVAFFVGGPMLGVLVGSMIANADRRECFDVFPDDPTPMDRQWTRADDQAAVARAWEQWTAGR